MGVYLHVAVTHGDPPKLGKGSYFKLGMCIYISVEI